MPDQIRPVTLPGSIRPDQVLRIVEDTFRRRHELEGGGFGTNEVFDHDKLAVCVRTSGGAFTVCSSSGKGEVYLVVLKVRRGDNYKVYAQPYDPDDIGGTFHKMTLYCGMNGNVQLATGW